MLTLQSQFFRSLFLLNVHNVPWKIRIKSKTEKCEKIKLKSQKRFSIAKKEAEDEEKEEKQSSKRAINCCVLLI